MSEWLLAPSWLHARYIHPHNGRCVLHKNAWQTMPGNHAMGRSAVHCSLIIHKRLHLLACGSLQPVLTERDMLCRDWAVVVRAAKLTVLEGKPDVQARL